MCILILHVLNMLNCYVFCWCVPRLWRIEYMAVGSVRMWSCKWEDLIFCFLAIFLHSSFTVPWVGNELISVVRTMLQVSEPKKVKGKNFGKNTLQRNQVLVGSLFRLLWNKCHIMRLMDVVILLNWIEARYTKFLVMVHNNMTNNWVISKIVVLLTTKIVLIRNTKFLQKC